MYGMESFVREPNSHFAGIFYIDVRKTKYTQVQVALNQLFLRCDSSIPAEPLNPKGVDRYTETKTHHRLPLKPSCHSTVLL